MKTNFIRIIYLLTCLLTGYNSIMLAPPGTMGGFIPEYGDLPKTAEEREIYNKYLKRKGKEKIGIEELSKMQLNKESINKLKVQYPELSFHNSLTIRQAMHMILASDIDKEKKESIVFGFYSGDLLDFEDLLKSENIISTYHLQGHRSLNDLFFQEKQKIEEQKAQEELKKINDAQKKGRKERKKSNPQEDFLNESVADIAEIHHKYYQEEKNKFIPHVTTVSNVLDQIVEKMNDPKYNPYRHMLRNAPEDLHRILSGHYNFSIKPTDKAKEEKYFSEKHPIITEDFIRNELNKRLEKYKEEKRAQSGEHARTREER